MMLKIKKTLKNKKLIIAVCLSLPFLIFVGLAIFYSQKHSAESQIGIGVGLPGTIVRNPGNYSYNHYILGLYQFSIRVAVALCTLMMIYAGFKYLTSRGDTGAINEAKDIIFSTLMGAALLILVVLVGNIAGFDTSGWFNPNSNSNNTTVNNSSHNTTTNTNNTNNPSNSAP